MRYYRDDIVKLNEDCDQEDVQADKNKFIKAIAGVVERRRNILLDEIKAIKESSAKIKNGNALTESEINAIQNAIQKIKSLRDLSKRVPGFVYEDFIDEYVNKYYRTVYRAWNTKHAIHRNFGYYEARDMVKPTITYSIGSQNCCRDIYSQPIVRHQARNDRFLVIIFGNS